VLAAEGAVVATVRILDLVDEVVALGESVIATIVNSVLL